MRKLIILLDVDGVLADFTGEVLRLGYRLFGRLYTPADVKEWDLFRLFSPEEQESIRLHITCEGFCLQLKVLPGSQDGVRRLRDLGDVYAVTAPWWDSKFWAHERTLWLRQFFDISKHETIHTSAKHLIHGDVMIDDKLENLVGWSHAQEERGWPTRAILVDAPYNQEFHPRVKRSRNWSDTVNLVKGWGMTDVREK